MRLLIDAGNTRTKWQLTDPLSVSVSQPVYGLTNANWFAGEQSPEVTLFAQALRSATDVWISQVAGAEWRQAFERLSPPAASHWLAAPAQASGLSNAYTQPALLGVDRWCSALAVWRQYQTHALIVSAGTAMTIDGIRMHAIGQATFLGGSIQPGLLLMWQAMQRGAAKLDHALPVPVATEAQPLFATDSQQAMWQGCLHALAGAVLRQYARFARTCETPPLLVLTGGDAALVFTQLSDIPAAQVICAEHLVLQGLATMAESVGT